MNSQYSKRTRATDQSFNSKTSELYNPLRDALIKSQFPIDRTSGFTSVVKQNFHSGLSNKICKLSPQLAKRIRETTIMHIQSQFLPTNKLYKVAGKGYTILDVQQKVNNPLTGSQFAKIPPANFQQIVYQVKENGSSRISKSSDPRKKKIKVSTQFLQEQEDKCHAFATKQSFKHFQNTQPKSLRAFQNQQSRRTHQSGRVGNLTVSHGIQPYKFKQDLLSEGSKIHSKLIKKKDYKYNLFSILDEIGNNGCSVGFKQNEICAPRRNPTQWN